VPSASHSKSGFGDVVVEIVSSVTLVTEVVGIVSSVTLVTEVVGIVSSVTLVTEVVGVVSSVTLVTEVIDGTVDVGECVVLPPRGGHNCRILSMLVTNPTIEPLIGIA